jgi:hypothetical protein
MPFFRSEQVTIKDAEGKFRGYGTKLLSAGYKAALGDLVDEENRRIFKLPPGSTWSDAIALQACKRAVGIVSKEQICFTAITELREATEGKIADRLVTNGNEELAALARALNEEPAPTV